MIKLRFSAVQIGFGRQPQSFSFPWVLSIGLRAGRELPIPTVSVEPLVAMHAINVQTEHDQQAVLQTLEMDLRMMKLEMRSMELDAAARQQLGDRIESLLTKTRQLDTSTPISY